jgi:hypothetical protein
MAYYKINDVVVETNNESYGTKIWNNPDTRPSWMNIKNLYDDKYSQIIEEPAKENLIKGATMQVKQYRLGQVTFSYSHNSCLWEGNPSLYNNDLTINLGLLTEEELIKLGATPIEPIEEESEYEKIELLPTQGYWETNWTTASDFTRESVNALIRNKNILIQKVRELERK